MKVLLTTESTNPDYSANCDCAVLNVTGKLLKRLKKRCRLARRAFEADAQLWELYFWYSEPEFYSCELLEARARDATQGQCVQAGDWTTWLRDAGFGLLPADFDTELFEPQYTECDQEILRCHRNQGRIEIEIAWTVIPKHSGIYITTAAITLEQLQAIAKGRPFPSSGIGDNS